MAAITMNHEFKVLLPDENGEEDGAHEVFTMPAGEYKVIGHTRTMLVIEDGDIQEGEGTNWLLHPVDLAHDEKE